MPYSRHYTELDLLYLTAKFAKCAKIIITIFCVVCALYGDKTVKIGAVSEEVCLFLYSMIS